MARKRSYEATEIKKKIIGKSNKAVEVMQRNKKKEERIRQ